MEVEMRNKNKNLARLLLLMSVLVIFSCNLPDFGTDNEAAILRLTVKALSTSVADKSADSPAAATPEVYYAESTVEAVFMTPTIEIPPTPISHNLVPSQPGWVARWFTDTDSSRTSGENRAPGGDTFSKNIFERPFTANDMVFRPDLDINKAEVSSDNNFIYFTVYLKGTNPQTSSMQGNYGVELDTDYDGRGNYLIFISNPVGTEWQMENVTAYKDPGKKVGGIHPMNADAPNGYIGYDQTIFSLENLTDPDAAWGRISPKGTSIIEFALKRSLIGGKSSFLWSVWADDGVKDVSKFDYNDHFTLNEAGSPYKDANYPLKALALVDSTCREVFNFTPTGDIPGLCAIPPTLTPTKKPTDVPPPNPGGITGLFFADNNNNGNRDPGDDPSCGGVSVWYHEGSCSGVGFISPIPLGGGCTFGINNLPAGQYCVSATGSQLTTPAQVDVNVPAGGNASVIFGLYVVP
jgi:hypothetical protein